MPGLLNSPFRMKDLQLEVSAHCHWQRLLQDSDHPTCLKLKGHGCKSARSLAVQGRSGQDLLHVRFRVRHEIADPDFLFPARWLAEPCIDLRHAKPLLGC